MKIVECFVGIQGEGSTAGRVRLFIRTSGCTLKCSFCDTKYHIQGREMTKADEKLMAENKHWCITGGEPLMRQKELVALINKHQPEWVEIETNGTIEPTLETHLCVNQFNVSPKEMRWQPKGAKPEPVIFKDEAESKQSKQGIVRDMAYSKFICKFVYSDKKSASFIKKIVKKYHIPAHKVWIMPEGTSKKAIDKMTKEVWAYCLKNKFNFSPRLHVTTFGTKKGI